MSKPKTADAPAVVVADVADPATAPAPAPPPVPWTAERVAEWNRYYDLYVVAGVLALVFLGSAHKITISTIWPQIQAGRLALTELWPPTRDLFSYTAAGARWVNIPWIFEVASAGLYDLGLGLGKTPERGEQVAAGLLVGLSATLRAATALVLLGIRRRGPGLWWSAACVALALGAMFVPIPRAGVGPLVLQLGGVAEAGDVEPATWGILLLAVELALLHAAANLGRRSAAYALPALFLLWANVDESFLIGLIVLAAAVAGLARRRSTPGAPTLDLPLGLAALAASALAVLVNPSTYHAYKAAAQPFLSIRRAGGARLLPEEFSIFGAVSRRELLDQIDATLHIKYKLYYFAVVGAGLASFVVDRARAPLSRLLVFLAAALLWAFRWDYGATFAVVAASTVALNGQEWYLSRFGTQGRLGRGWAVWSIGGRFLTLLAIFGAVAVGLTGFGPAGTIRPVGFGVDPEVFPFESADYLKRSPLAGNVLNFNESMGDALAFRAWPRTPSTWAITPGRKSYFDSRRHLFPAAVRADLSAVRRALVAGDKARWGPILDRDKVSAVVLEIGGEPSVYKALSADPGWVEFYDDGSVVMLGRKDAPAEDVAYFEKNRLEADQIVYKRGGLYPSSTQPPAPVSWVDRIFRARAEAPIQPHGLAARRWLDIRRKPDLAAPPDPAHCFAAIRDARIALHTRPDDPDAFRILYLAYNTLFQREAEIGSRGGATGVPLQVGSYRFRQRVTALSYAIQTTPPPTSPPERDGLANLHLQMADLFTEVNFYDLELKALQEARALTPADEFPQARRDRLEALAESVEASKKLLDDAAEQPQNGPVQLASMAMQRGCPGLAMGKLALAEDQGVSLATVKSQLVDLYLQTGQPEKTFDLVANIDDPALNTGPGTPSYRFGMVSLLIGDYENASSLWRDRAIVQLRNERTSQALLSARSLLGGQIKAATVGIRELPGELQQGAEWEAELGLCLLEMGDPEGAATHMAEALKLRPTLQIRPLLAYYLEKIGKAVPPVGPDPSPAASTSPADALAAPK